MGPPRNKREAGWCDCCFNFGSGVGHAVVPLPFGGDTYFTFLLFGDSSHGVFGVDNVRVTGDPVPEPGSLLLLGAGLLGLCFLARRRHLGG